MTFDLKSMTSFISSYLGYIILAVIIVYLCSKDIKIMEGLESKKSVTSTTNLKKNIQTIKEDVEGELKIDFKNNRQNFKDSLVGLEDILHLKMLNTIQKSGGHIMDEKTLTSLTQLQSAKSALVDLDEFLIHFKA